MEIGPLSPEGWALVQSAWYSLEKRGEAMAHREEEPPEATTRQQSANLSERTQKEPSLLTP